MGRPLRGLATLTPRIIGTPLTDQSVTGDLARTASDRRPSGGKTAPPSTERASVSRPPLTGCLDVQLIPDGRRWVAANECNPAAKQ